MLSTLVASPFTIGANTTLIVQLELIGRADPQLLVWIKGPPTAIDEKLKVPTFVFVRVIVCGVPRDPTVTRGKTTPISDRLSAGLLTDNCKLPEWVNVESDVPVTVTGNTPPGVPI